MQVQRRKTGSFSRPAYKWSVDSGEILLTLDLQQLRLAVFVNGALDDLTMS